MDTQIFIGGLHPGMASYDRNGEKLWQFEVQPALFYTPQYYSDQQQSIEASPVLVGDALLFGAMDCWLYQLDSKSGAIVWKTFLGTPILASAAVTSNGFYICDFAGNLYRFKSKD